MSPSVLQSEILDVVIAVPKSIRRRYGEVYSCAAMRVAPDSPKKTGGPRLRAKPAGSRNLGIWRITRPRRLAHAVFLLRDGRAGVIQFFLRTISRKLLRRPPAIDRDGGARQIMCGRVT